MKVNLVFQKDPSSLKNHSQIKIIIRTHIIINTFIMHIFIGIIVIIYFTFIAVCILQTNTLQLVLSLLLLLLLFHF